ncbi:MAG: winged helix DNA-binding domain-containing protein [Nocardioides sp.]|nr:winged helix DNA-binding domain-containing protein [Nocardioides sp.]
MRLGPRDLNRTLLGRQQLLARTQCSVQELAARLIGLQAQENLSPFLSLASRVEEIDPRSVTRGLEDRTLVRLLTMRGTIHLLTADDALALRQWTRPAQERERGSSQGSAPALHLDTVEFNASVSDLLSEGPLTGKELGAGLAARFSDTPPTALTNLARINQPLAQLPPRGGWRQSGGVVYQHVDRWLGRPFIEPNPAEIVRRFLRAFGPARAADVTAWSGVTGIAAVVKAMDDLVTHTDESGRTLYDVPDAPIHDGDEPAPVRLLGTYDNVWLAHAGRDRVTTPAARKRWAGPNGGVANTVFVDGMLEGLWRVEGDRISIDLFRDLTRDQRSQLDDEIIRTEAFLAD